MKKFDEQTKYFPLRIPESLVTEIKQLANGVPFNDAVLYLIRQALSKKEVQSKWSAQISNVCVVYTFPQNTKILLRRLYRSESVYPQANPYL